MDEEKICDKLDSLIDVNRETQRWLKVMAWERVRKMVMGALGEDAANYQLYDSLDGETRVNDIVEPLSFSKRTAYRRIDEWQQIGIVSRVERGRYDKMAPLDSLGIDPPEDSE